MMRNVTIHIGSATPHYYDIVRRHRSAEDEAVRKMVAAHGSWQTAYDLTRRLQREEAPGGCGAYHWNKMLDAFERSRTVGK